MATNRLLIDWPLTPYTGWGSYGIQLAQGLIASSVARPVLTSYADRSPHCEPHWLTRLDELERFSRSLIEHLRANPHEVLSTNCQVVLSPIGNQVPPLRVLGKNQVGVTFFERSQLDQVYQDKLDQYELVITGSCWNQKVLEDIGYRNSVLVHQGVNTSLFNPIPVPRLLQRPFVIFAGGKLEYRKGQDIVISAFRTFLNHCPNALLISCWGNLGNVGLDTIGRSPYVNGSPGHGNGEQLYEWLLGNGLPAHNLMMPTIMANMQLPSLIKQADVAVFTSRCEGGTNLMAMETLACGIPTLLSANTGHLDLLNMNLEHAIGLAQTSVDNELEQGTAGYGGDEGDLWGETDPDLLVEHWLAMMADKEGWVERGQRGAQKMASMSWSNSMEKLIAVLQTKGMLTE